MSQNTTSDQEQAEPRNKVELLHRIDHAWSQLNQSLQGLTEAQLTTMQDSQGWSVKDHLVHLTAWEQSLLALLQGRNRDQAIGLDAGARTDMEIDDVNALIQQHNQQRSLVDVQAAFQRSHAEVVVAITALSDEDLFKPYSHYQPNDPPVNNDPVVGWIIGNTYAHYEEHDAWIHQLISTSVIER